MNATENLLTEQLQQSRESTKLYKKVTIDMARAALKKLPREDLIEMLIKKKIIEHNWERGSNKYKLKENG